MYLEMNTEIFIKMILQVDNFLDFNKTSLYILRDGNWYKKYICVY